MDTARSRVKEHSKNRNRKLLFGFIAVLILVILVFWIENQINSHPKEVTIMKNEISEEKAVFIPLKKLDTNIIAVKATDGGYRLAFDDCMGCYYQFGKHEKFENNADNTGLICKNCKSEIMYDEIGYLLDESTPYPIAEAEITSLEDRFILPAEYLEMKKQELQEMRSGKLINRYSENPNK